MAFRALFGVLVALYPFAVYVGLTRGYLRGAALIVVVAALGRMALFSQRKGLAALLSALAALLALSSILLSRADGLLLYPVAMNLSVMSIFLLSLFSQRSAVERIARARDPELPHEAIQYCKQVTRVWCAVCASNAAVALFLIRAGNLWWWSLYNGLIAYLVMGLVFGVELLVRKQFLKRTRLTTL